MKKDYQVILDLYHNEIPAIVNVETGELTTFEDVSKLKRTVTVEQNYLEMLEKHWDDCIGHTPTKVLKQ